MLKIILENLNGFIGIKIMIGVTVVLVGCHGLDHKSTNEICDGKAYVENHSVFGSGAFGGDLVADFLTDSLSFVLFIGEYDNYNQDYYYKCTGDTIIVWEVQDNVKSNSSEVINTQYFYLPEIRKVNNYTSKRSLKESEMLEK